MLEVAAMCSLNNFEAIFRYVAKKRAELAKELQHGVPEGADSGRYSQCDFFGRFRTKQYKTEYESAHFNRALVSQECFTTDDERKQLWPRQAPHVIAYCSQPEMIFDEGGVKEIISPYGDYYISPYDHCASPMSLSCIRKKTISKSGKPIDTVHIEYTQYYDETANAQWKIANLLYNNVMRSDDANFLNELAKLLHYESHLMRTYRGTESILQIIIRQHAIRSLLFIKTICCCRFRI